MVVELLEEVDDSFEDLLELPELQLAKNKTKQKLAINPISCPIVFRKIFP